MNSYRRNDARRQRRALLLATLLALLLFAGDALSGGRLRESVRAAAGATWRAASAVSARIGGSGLFASKAHLASENAELKQRLAQLEEDAAAYQVLAAQNDQLRSMLHLASVSPGIAAPVVSSFKASAYGTFEIGAGARSGVVKGALVLSQDGFVIGRVVDAGASESLVAETLAPGASVDVLVGDIPLTLSGQGGGSAVGQAPRGSAIATGTPAVAPALGGQAVGLVGATAGGIADPAVTVYVHTPVDLSTLRFVFVEKGTP